MNERFEQLLYDSLKPEAEPEPNLNRRILERRLKKDMRKSTLRKTLVAAAIGCVVITGGVSAYAASQNLSLLSLFKGESKKVQNNAANLLDQSVKQEASPDKKQSQPVQFQVTEAICDNNKVIVRVAAKAKEPEKYLLIPHDEDLKFLVSDLEIEGIDKETEKQTIGEYAKSLGKECLKVAAYIPSPATGESISYHTDAEGTLFCTITFRNEEKTKKLNYVCQTSVFPAESKSEADEVKDEFAFTLTDKSDSQTIRYLPVSKGKVKGTNLVVDEVTFEKSDLEMICNVKYHYAGEAKNWENTPDYDICFFLLDEDGKIIESGEGGGTIPDGNTFTQSWEYSLADLPDTITFRAEDVMEDVSYGTVELKLAK